MQITPRSYAVTGLAYSPPWFVNAGFIAGDHATLIVDTGGNSAAAATILGYAQAVRPANHIIALNTERHFDHIGGNSYLRDRKIDIWGHEALIRMPEEFAAEIDEVNDTIANRARHAHREAEVFFAGTKLALPNCTVADGMTFDLGGITAEVIFTPGHTSTNISVLADDVLFCGDCLIDGYLPNLDAGRENDWRQWLESLDRVERIAPAAVVPGHGGVLTGNGVASAIQRVRAILREALRTGVTPTAAHSSAATR
jgi:glyoxylase-like metal-dependent hydrolase (beta-lactamase superfamily II)